MRYVLPVPTFHLPERASTAGARPEAVRVLVVDDSEAFQEVMCAVVAEAEGFEVVGVAASGEDALGQVAPLAVDFVLIDRAMPGMDGIETAHRIHEHHPDVVTVVLTATPPLDSMRVRRLAIEDKRNLTPDWLSAYWHRHNRR